MKITKDKIVVSNKTYDIDEIKCADYEKSETSVRAITVPLIVIVAMVLYFHSNILLFFMLFFLIVATIPTRTIYTITINNDIFDDYKTYNKKEFEQKKEKINKILSRNQNNNSHNNNMDKFKIN